ncbi:MAG: hypothetical protein JJE47_01015 [Acidimicrobiia bacterium]|nr:hypothetical protein [Acidimicrobiia bacterium]
MADLLCSVRSEQALGPAWVLLTRSELIHIMVASDLAIRSGEAGGDWATIYAERVRSFAAQKLDR